MIKFTYIAFVVILILVLYKFGEMEEKNSMIIIVVNIIQHQNQG